MWVKRLMRSPVSGETTVINAMSVSPYYNIFTVRGTAASRVLFRIVALTVRMGAFWPDVVPQGQYMPRKSIERTDRRGEWEGGQQGLSVIYIIYITQAKYDVDFNHLGKRVAKIA